MWPGCTYTGSISYVLPVVWVTESPSGRVSECVSGDFIACEVPTEVWEIIRYWTCNIVQPDGSGITLEYYENSCMKGLMATVCLSVTLEAVVIPCSTHFWITDTKWTLTHFHTPCGIRIYEPSVRRIGFVACSRQCGCSGYHQKYSTV